MNNYEIRMIDQNGERLSENVTSGDTAMHALEGALESGLVYLPPGVVRTALVINCMSGITIKLEVAQAE